MASTTTAPVSGPRSKSYWARSSVRLAPSMNPATAAAMSSAGWPPSVRVRIVISGFIERLVDARIGATFNFYRDGERAALLRGRLEAYLESRIEAPLLLVAEAPGYRGARISGVPLTSERQLTGEGPAEATATIVHAALGELGLSDACCSGTSFRPTPATRARTGGRAARRSTPGCLSPGSSPADGGSSPSGGSRTPLSAATTSGIPHAAERRDFRRGLALAGTIA